MTYSHNKIKGPTALIILDGWGIAPSWGGNAISQAKTKVFNKIFKDFPSTTLLASGDAVGLPSNSPGNSEAGHLNLGAGKIVHQDITLIDKTIEDPNFYQNSVLLGSIAHAKKYDSSIHLLGLLSKTGIHSHIRHLFALLKFYKQNNFNKVYIHLFSDGRDSDPMDGIVMIEEVERNIAEIGIGRIASISGRFFAMDRDNRWGRIARAYNLLVRGEGNIFPTPKSAFSSAYAAGQTDEFIEPRLIFDKTQPKAIVEDNDCVIMFNLRSDRTKELTKAFLIDILPEFPDRKKLVNLYFASFSPYEESKLVKRFVVPENVLDPLAKVWADNGLRQFHSAETEKYPHVTYFINGGVEKPFWGEDRAMVPSPRNVKTYDHCPKMNADKVTGEFISALNKKIYGGFVVNYCNGDMVGHTGNLSAAVQAVECVDECVGRILAAIVKSGGRAIVTADHGNVEQMVNPSTGEADTEHTTNPVPFIFVSSDPDERKIMFRGDGVLAAVSPTILDLMDIKKPDSMVNESLIIKNNFKI